jgi:glycosyltransferase involved in cell wall biosynthesis
LKTLFVLHYPPPVHGSAVIGGYIKDSRLINESFNCRFINLGTSASVEDIGHNSIGKLLRYLSLVWQVKKQLLLFRPELCYITPTARGAGFYKDALVIAIVKLFGVRTVYHFHNKGISDMQDRFFDNLLYRFVFRKSHVILLSKHLYSDINKYIPQDRVYYCANGIPDLKEKRQNLKDKSIGAVPEILFLSHLIKSKGVLVLIDACDILKERGVDFHCTLAGGNAELTQEDVEKVIEDKGLTSDVSVVGQIHGDDKAELMITSDIFVHPTYNDCMPLVLLEAMQYSLPIVSTFEGAIPDIVEDGATGILVPQKDASVLAEKLEKLINDPDLRIKMRREGRLKYEREFTLESFEVRMKKILKKVGSRTGWDE